MGSHNLSGNYYTGSLISTPLQWKWKSVFFGIAGLLSLVEGVLSRVNITSYTTVCSSSLYMFHVHRQTWFTPMANLIFRLVPWHWQRHWLDLFILSALKLIPLWSASFSKFRNVVWKITPILCRLHCVSCKSISMYYHWFVTPDYISLTLPAWVICIQANNQSTD